VVRELTNGCPPTFSYKDQVHAGGAQCRFALTAVGGSSVTSVQEEIDALTKEGIDAIVLLSHSGTKADLDLVPKLAGVDVVVSAHDHVFAGDQEKQASAGLGEPVVVRCDAPHPCERDGALARAIEDTLRPVASLTERVITTLPRAMPPSEHDESELGTRMADAMLHAARPFGATLAIAEGDFRAGLSAGVVTYGDVYAAWPFPLRIVVVELTGAELPGLVGRWLRSNDPPPQAAGIAIEYTRKDSADHATSKLLTMTVSGKPLAPIKRTRSLSTNTWDGLQAIRPSSRPAHEAAARTRRSSREKPSSTSSRVPPLRAARSHDSSSADPSLRSWAAKLLDSISWRGD
jgi:2',3'-cyclic-nucleotide 2'-phosphodiesterase (5'-nucleotidase family)